MRLAEESGVIEGTITRIDAFGLFSTGWIGYGFLYETPTLFITCETDFGTVQIESSFENYTSSGLSKLLEPADPVDICSVNLENLVGLQVYIAPDEQKQYATIGWDNTIQYTESHSVRLRSDTDRKDLDAVEVQSRLETGYEPKPVDWMNKLLTIDYNRYTSGQNGWLEVPFEYYGETDDAHFFTAQLPRDEQIYWKFNANINGIEKIEEFLSNLGIDYTPEEFDSETIWIKPIRDLHHSNRPKTLNRVDTEEFWVASASPQQPKENKSVFKKIKDLLTPSQNIDVSVSTKSRDRRAKSSATKTSPRPSEPTGVFDKENRSHSKEQTVH
jgi:hypothetical protein